MKTTNTTIIRRYVKDGVRSTEVIKTYEGKRFSGRECADIWIKAIGACGILLQACVSICKIRESKKSSSSSSTFDAQETGTVDVPLRASTTYGQHKSDGVDDGTKFLVENVRRGGINFIAGPTGSCKSTLVVQMLTAIASGFRSVFDVAKDVVSHSKGQKCFLYDAERLKDEWVSNHCSGGNKPPMEVVHKMDCRFRSVQDLVEDIRKRVVLYGMECTVAIDNLTRIFGSINDALANELYNGLESIQNKMDSQSITVTFIVVSHTNDEIPAWHGIYERSVRGSGNLVNFSDNCIGINHSRFGKMVKYIKPMKERQSGTDTVVRVRWSNSPYWHLIYEGEYMENEVKPLRPKSSAEDGKGVDNNSAKKEERPTDQDREVIVRMRSEGATVKSIANALGICVRTYYYYLDKLGISK